MSSLDEKLKEILQAVWKEDNLYFAEQGLDYDLEGNSPSAISLIKQAFKDGGYVEIELPSETKRREWEEAHNQFAGDLLTGAEWLERFEKEINKPIQGTNHQILHELQDRQRYLEAAKKASGLDTEG